MNIDKNQYMPGKKASEILGVHQRTLHLWDKNGKIEVVRAPGGKRFYNVAKYMKDQGFACEKMPTKEIECVKIEELDKIKGKISICYARVSSIAHKEELERQKEILKKEYPSYVLLEDIGSGMDLMKKSLLKIINLAIVGKIKELVVVHKDRLARFSYELLEYLIKEYSNGKITILDETKEKEPQEEMLQDVLQIMNVFVEKYKKNKK
jgi:predicted site-specific integrase-resolvase